VRNGNRWHVTAINPDNSRLIARRLDDKTLAAFSDDYVREHITHSYAVTVHSAQGVTADTTHAVLSQATTRALFYVAISRGRDTNTAYLYQRTTEHEYPHEPTDATHLTQRGSSQAAGQLLRAIVANNDEQPVTAHDMAAQSPDSALSERVRSLFDRRVTAVQRRRATTRAGRQTRRVSPFPWMEATTAVSAEAQSSVSIAACSSDEPVPALRRRLQEFSDVVLVDGFGARDLFVPNETTSEFENDGGAGTV
jgi:hypothetical protein